MSLAQLIIVLAAFAYCSCYDRKVTSSINYGCPECHNSTEITLNYVKAVGENDTVHQIWDFTSGTPNIIFGITKTNSTLTIDWSYKRPTSFNFSEGTIYSFGLVLNRIVEYNDTDDKGIFNASLDTIFHNTTDLKWNRTVLVDKEDEVMLQVESVSHDLGENASVIIKLDYRPTLDYAKELPHLLHTANSSQFDVQFVNLNSNFINSRFAMELIVISTDDKTDSMHMDEERGLDDEHTPGIFEIIEIKTPETWRRSNGGFIEYRPIAYTQSRRTIQDSTSVVTPTPIDKAFNSTNLTEASTSITYFHMYSEKLLMQSTILMFGLSSDGFYKNTNYTAWTCSIGYGVPPTEHFSLFVILIISFGLGIPVVILIAGGMYMYCRKRRANDEGLQSLKEED